MKQSQSVTMSGDEEAFSAALQNACTRLKILEQDVATYVLKNMDEVKQELKSNTHFSLDSSLFDHWTEEERDAWYSHQAKIYVRPEVQYRQLIGNRFQAEYVTIVLTSATLVEALINNFIAYGLAVKQQAELFDLVDTWRVLEKWEHGPKLFLEDYRFPKDLTLWKVLKETVSVRNAIAHYKLMLKIGDDAIYKGRSIYSRATVDEGIQWLKQVANLPYELNLFLVKVCIFTDYEMPSCLAREGFFTDSRIVDWVKYDHSHSQKRTDG